MEDQAFAVVEGVVAKHYAGWDNFGVREVPRAIGELIASEWRQVAQDLGVLGTDQAGHALNLEKSGLLIDPSEVATFRPEIAALLIELAGGLDEFYAQNEYVTIIGI